MKKYIIFLLIAILIGAYEARPQLRPATGEGSVKWADLTGIRLEGDSVVVDSPMVVRDLQIGETGGVPGGGTGVSTVVFRFLAGSTETHGLEGGDAWTVWKADQGDDNADIWRAGSKAAGGFFIQSYSTGAYGDAFALSTTTGLTVTPSRVNADTLLGTNNMIVGTDKSIIIAIDKNNDETDRAFLVSKNGPPSAVNLFAIWENGRVDVQDSLAVADAIRVGISGEYITSIDFHVADSVWAITLISGQVLYITPDSVK